MSTSYYGGYLSTTLDKRLQRYKKIPMYDLTEYMHEKKYLLNTYFNFHDTFFAIELINGMLKK